MSGSSGYVGRFAPSPSGPLHLGSLTTAVASYLDACQHQGQWHLRFDDLDTPRNQAGAVDAILRSLELHQLQWHGPVIYQSQRLPAYIDAMQQLQQQQLLYPCTCSRRMLSPGAAYPGTCRQSSVATLQLPQAPQSSFALRINCQAAQIRFHDQVCGQQQVDLASSSGDFIVWRRDGQPSYQLATAVDDGCSEVTHVVRGNDLLADTARQLLLIDRLGGQRPQFAHLPVVVDAAGVKLSKRTGAVAVDDHHPASNLARVLGYLGLTVPADVNHTNPTELLAWAVPRWRMPVASEANWIA